MWDTFIYFSHKLVCIQPPTWTNTLHRTGVKVFGILIIEPQTPNIEQLLEERDGQYPVTDQLALMAGTFGFDGWLLNVEKVFAANMTEDMIGFMKALREGLAPAYKMLEAIWHDALTVDNVCQLPERPYPEELGDSSGSNRLLYKLQTSKQLAEETGMSLSSIYFYIDLWAQNTNMPGLPRITYPGEGGGTYTSYVGIASFQL